MASERNTTEKSTAETNKDTFSFCGYRDVNEFSQATLQALMGAVRSSNELPSAGDDFDYYSSFTPFQHYKSSQGTRLLQLIQSVMRYHGARGSISANSELMDTQDRFDILVDVNDQLLERAGTLLDEASGLRKKETSLVVVTKTPKQQVASGGWNKTLNRPPSGSKSGQSYRLLTARQVTRPQINFKEKIDNSERPFVPKISTKPNALQPLADSIVCETSEDLDSLDASFSYPHPYRFELDRYSPDAVHLEPANLQNPLSLEDTPLTMVETLEALQELCKVLKAQTEFAVDVEHHSYRSYQGIACLIQISTRAQDYLVDALSLREHLYLLNDSFTDPKILKVLHGADQDVMWLQRDFGVYLVGVFDTHQASRSLAFPRHRLQDLLCYYCDVETNKELQLEDWRIRPLPEEFMLYARMDTHYLLYIYDRMKNDLLERGNARKNVLLSVFQRSTQICLRTYKKPQFTGDSYKEVLLSHRKAFNSQQLEALKAIYAWRDHVAREEDESTGYVLPNLMMLQMAELLPREPEGILACCTHIPPVVQQNLADLHRIIKTAREQPVSKKEMTPVLPSRSFHSRPDATKVVYCPHDSSRNNVGQGDARDFDTNLAAVKSALFSDGSATEVEVKETPVLTAFMTGANQSPVRTSAAQRAADIIRSFVNPFTKYLPAADRQQSDVPANSASDAEVWKLLPHTAKPTVNTSKIQTVEVVETAPTILFSGPVKPEKQPDAGTVREQMNQERYVKNSGESPSETTLTKKKRKRPAKLEDDEANVAEQVKPHDYGNVDLKKLFEGDLLAGVSSKSKHEAKKKKKKQEFDAKPVIAEADFKPTTKQRPLMHRPGNKSLTYGTKVDTKTSAPKIPWPK